MYQQVSIQYPVGAKPENASYQKDRLQVRSRNRVTAAQTTTNCNKVQI